MPKRLDRFVKKEKIIFVHYSLPSLNLLVLNFSTLVRTGRPLSGRIPDLKPWLPTSPSSPPEIRPACAPDSCSHWGHSGFLRGPVGKCCERGPGRQGLVGPPISQTSPATPRRAGWTPGHQAALARFRSSSNCSKRWARGPLGWRFSTIPAWSGVRPPLTWLHDKQQPTRFCQVVDPPWQSGTT